MKLKTTRQHSLEKIKTDFFDLIIMSSGYEERATHLIDKLDMQNSEKIAIGFNNACDNPQRMINDKIFLDAGFIIKMSDGDEDSVIIDILNNTLATIQKTELNILVDYSSMTRVWYSSLIHYFTYNSFPHLTKLNISFSYSFSKYLPAPKKHSLNMHVGPIKGFSTITIPNKPSCLIIGLGYEKNRAYGLTEYLDAETFVFYTDKSSENKFSDEVEENNKELISKINQNNIFQYPINDLEYTESILISLCKNLIDEFRLIIAPCGPKPFTLLSLLVAVRLDNIDVWRISPGINGHTANQEASGEISVYSCSFINE